MRNCSSKRSIWLLCCLPSSRDSHRVSVSQSLDDIAHVVDYRRHINNSLSRHLHFRSFALGAIYRRTSNNVTSRLYVVPMHQFFSMYLAALCSITTNHSQASVVPSRNCSEYSVIETQPLNKPK